MPAIFSIVRGKRVADIVSSSTRSEDCSCANDVADSKTATSEQLKFFEFKGLNIYLINNSAGTAAFMGTSLIKESLARCLIFKVVAGWTRG